VGEVIDSGPEGEVVVDTPLEAEVASQAPAAPALHHRLEPPPEALEEEHS